jgi:hypothetical protein
MYITRVCGCAEAEELKMLLKKFSESNESARVDQLPRIYALAKQCGEHQTEFTTELFLQYKKYHNNETFPYVTSFNKKCDRSKKLSINPGGPGSGTWSDEVEWPDVDIDYFMIRTSGSATINYEDGQQELWDLYK